MAVGARGGSVTSCPVPRRRQHPGSGPALRARHGRWRRRRPSACLWLLPQPCSVCEGKALARRRKLPHNPGQWPLSPRAGAAGGRPAQGSRSDARVFLPGSPDFPAPGRSLTSEQGCPPRPQALTGLSAPSSGRPAPSLYLLTAAACPHAGQEAGLHPFPRVVGRRRVAVAGR